MNKQTWIWFGLWLLSLVGFMLSIVVIPVQVVYRFVSRKYDNRYYFHQLAVANDVSIGSMLYGSRFTVSAITGYKAHTGDRWHKIQAKVIDLFFGKNHCYNEAVDEKLIKGMKNQ